MIWLDLQRSSGTALSQQLYRQLIDGILGGGLAGGTRLPSSREFAAGHHIARNIVIAVYEQLIAEGFLETRAGSGTFVARLEHLDELAPGSTVARRKAVPAAAGAGAISFVCGTPDLEQFPRARWMGYLRQVGFFRDTATWGYAPPGGDPALRREIAAHLLRVKGIRATPEQIVITPGTAASLWIVALLLGDGPRRALVEDPVVSFVPEILRRAGCEVVPALTDGEGLIVDALPPRPRAALVFLSPSHQFPLGSTLPIQRRLAALEYARRHDLFLVEDDYDSEFRHEGTPVSSLFRLNAGRVIHLGTFSKCLAPALRLGYVVLPGPLVDRAAQSLAEMNLGASRYVQEALARFMGAGHLERHIVRMQRLYRRKMRQLVAALDAAFGAGVAITGNSTGLHLVATFAGLRFDAAARGRMTQHGVAADAVDDFALGRARHPGALALGFGHLSPGQIDEGVRRLTAAIGAAWTPPRRQADPA